MYHIKEDRRSQRSAWAIYEAVAELLRKKGWEEVTVAEIQRVSKVSRATFYRHFDHLADVLAWQCDVLFAKMYEEYQLPKEEKARGAYDFVAHLLKYWTLHSEVLELLLKVHRADIIYDCHVRYFQRFAREMCLPTEEGEAYAYGMGMRSGLLVGVLTVWLHNRKRQSAEEIFEILKKQMEQWRKSDILI